jgi:hypothetical protein
MPSSPDHDEISLPLVSRLAPTTGSWRVRGSRSGLPQRSVLPEADLYEDSLILEVASEPDDRMRPAVSGGIAGILAGLAGLGVVHWLAPMALTRPLLVVAEARGVDLGASFAIAYATTAAAGSLVGAAFAVVTRYLRRWIPLALWAVVFFVSLTLLVLAAVIAHGRGVSSALLGPILAASVAFGIVVSFSLPIRRRR